MEHAITQRAAREALSLGYDLLLLKEGRKEPWRRGWNERLVDPGEIDYYLRRYRLNYGILLRGLCVLDKDGPSRQTTELLRAHGVRSPMEVVTRRGTHIYLRLPSTMREVRSRLKWLGLGLDVKCTGYMVGPGSHIAETGWTYRLKHRKRWVGKEQLPTLPDSLAALLDAEKPVVGSTTLRTTRSMQRGTVRHPEAYVLRIASVQGQNGSAALVRAVCVMRDAGRSAHETATYLCGVWSPACAVPPWSESEIVHAVRRHFAREEPLSGTDRTGQG
jgi:hypothetical protein